MPLKVNFKQENFLGMNATDYGGGTPVADVWRRDIGIAVGHLEHAPKLVSLPVADAGRDARHSGAHLRDEHRPETGSRRSTPSTASSPSISATTSRASRTTAP